MVFEDIVRRGRPKRESVTVALSRRDWIGGEKRAQREDESTESGPVLGSWYLQSRRFRAAGCSWRLLSGLVVMLFSALSFLFSLSLSLSRT